jgi:hypothetical protein
MVESWMPRDWTLLVATLASAAGSPIASWLVLRGVLRTQQTAERNVRANHAHETALLREKAHRDDASRRFGERRDAYVAYIQALDEALFLVPVVRFGASIETGEFLAAMRRVSSTGAAVRLNASMELLGAFEISVESALGFAFSVLNGSFSSAEAVRLALRKQREEIVQLMRLDLEEMGNRTLGVMPAVADA